MPANQHEHVLDQVIQTISSVSGVEPSELNGQTSLLSDLNLDSLAMFEIVIDLEEIFQLQISDDDIDKIKTIDDIVRYVERYIF
jgi:acyl carrier protein